MANQIFPKSGLQLIFILGIMHRSGTNFLNSLLLRHEAVDYAGITWEDFLLEHAELLEIYAEKTSKHWHES